MPLSITSSEQTGSNLSRTSDARVLDELAQLIADQQIKPGDKLPPERTLTEQLSVGRSTIREALTRWEALGMVERRQGSGTYLITPIEPASPHVPIALKVEAESLIRTIEVRKVLECEAIALAAINRSEEQMDEIRECWRTLKSAHEKYGPSHDEDVEFHSAIMRASGNPLFNQIVNQLQEAMRVVYTRKPLGNEHIGDTSFPLHYDLLLALEAKDPNAARQIIKNIIEITENEVREFLK
ncbi:FadR/GntR family transcriptional regulator [Kiloniella sp. EL199]|uniref:FadR/GntR family transcriptional regulator n=1 Tax=Kiloniella sp. EL199 TaxID=2107581 RepID=UPI0013C43444|nr:FadR/GntR family transcriptional regulator [Kiloniella sp. EL199]